MALTDIQSAFLEGALLVGQLFGVGGSSWTVTRATGDGITAAVSSATAGTITGYVRRMRRTAMAPAAPGAQVPDAVWVLVAETDQDVRVGDRVTSAEDAKYTFAVVSREFRPGYAICELEP